MSEVSEPQRLTSAITTITPTIASPTIPAMTIGSTPPPPLAGGVVVGDAVATGAAVGAMGVAVAGGAVGDGASDGVGAGAICVMCRITFSYGLPLVMIPTPC